MFSFIACFILLVIAPLPTSWPVERVLRLCRKLLDLLDVRQLHSGTRWTDILSPDVVLVRVLADDGCLHSDRSFLLRVFYYHVLCNRVCSRMWYRLRLRHCHFSSPATNDFLPRNATQSAVLPRKSSVRPPVCRSVCRPMSVCDVGVLWSHVRILRK